LSQSGLQKLLRGLNHLTSRMLQEVAAGKSPGVGIKDPSPALLIVLYVAVVAAGLCTFSDVFMGNEALRKWVVTLQCRSFFVS